MVDISLSSISQQQGLDDAALLQEPEEEMDSATLLKNFSSSSKADIDAVTKEALATLAHLKPKGHIAKEGLSGKLIFEQKSTGSNKRFGKKFEQQVGTKAKLATQKKQDLAKVKKGLSTPGQKKLELEKPSVANPKKNLPQRSKSKEFSNKTQKNETQGKQTELSKGDGFKIKNDAPLPQKKIQSLAKKTTPLLAKKEDRPSVSKKNHSAHPKKLQGKKGEEETRDLKGNKQKASANQLLHKERTHEKDERGRGDQQKKDDSQQEKEKKKKKISALQGKRKKTDVSKTKSLTPLEKTEILAEKKLSVNNFSVSSSFPIRRARMVSMGSVMDLFFEILKLFITHREQNKYARRAERNLQIKHKMLEVENLREQGKWLLYTGIGSGVLGIASGALPILGVVKGEWIQQNLLGRLSSKMADMKTHKLFDGASKMAQSMSEMYKVTGQVTTTYAEADRKWDEERNSVARTEGDEFTSEIREKQDDWQSFLRFIQEVMQMDQDAIRQLYR